MHLGFSFQQWVYPNTTASETLPATDIKDLGMKFAPAG